MSATPKNNYTVKEAAEYLAFSPKTIRRLIRRGVLRASKVTAKIKIPALDVEKLIESTC